MQMKLMQEKSVKDLGIKAIGKYKLQVDLERPVPYINELLALNTFNPQNEKVAKKFGEQYGTTAEKQCTMDHLK